MCFIFPILSHSSTKLAPATKNNEEVGMGFMQPLREKCDTAKLTVRFKYWLEDPSANSFLPMSRNGTLKLLLKPHRTPDNACWTGREEARGGWRMDCCCHWEGDVSGADTEMDRCKSDCEMGMSESVVQCIPLVESTHMELHYYSIDCTFC